MAELEWETTNDPFWGTCILIRGLSFDREKKDYVALFTGADDPKWEFTRRFLKHRHGVCLIPADGTVKSQQFWGVSLDGAVLEIRVDGTKYLRLINQGALQEIAPENVRPAIAAWLFSTGQSLHP